MSKLKSPHDLESMFLNYIKMLYVYIKNSSKCVCCACHKFSKEERKVSKIHIIIMETAHGIHLVSLCLWNLQKMKRKVIFVNNKNFLKSGYRSFFNNIYYNRKRIKKL